MATYNEEVTTRAKYKTWKVTTTDCRGRVEHTYKLMTPSQALEYFNDAIAVMGLNSDITLNEI